MIARILRFFMRQTPEDKARELLEDLLLHIGQVR
jgi:hypothetical protein